MNFEEKLELVKRNTSEILEESELKKLLKEKTKPIAYWGTATTGKPHLGYLFSVMKIADLLKAGFHVKILLADLHASLDRTPWKILETRYNYYKKIIPLAISLMNKDTKELEFVKGSDLELNKDYFLDLLKLSTFSSVHDAQKAGSEVVKQEENPKLSGLLYPLLQIADEKYLKTDVQLGGSDQRKIFVLARQLLPKIDSKKNVEILHPLIPGLIGKKMSASIDSSMIGFLDTEKEIKEKIRGAACVSGDLDNGLIPFIKYILMTIKKDKGEDFIIKRPSKFGGDLVYRSYEDLEKDFVSKKLHPLDLKNALSEEIINFLKPLNKYRKDLEILEKKAYD